MAGNKHDTGKPPLSLLDNYALRATADVLAFGAAKYGRDNWREGIAVSRLLDAALRHIYACADGEDIDQESALPTLAHAICCLMFALKTLQTRPDLDDRYTSTHKDRTIGQSAIPSAPQGPTGR